MTPRTLKLPAVTEIEKQMLFLVKTYSVQMPCPLCDVPCNMFEACGVKAEFYDWSGHGRICHCPVCNVKIVDVVPVFDARPWFWALEGKT